jgi:predicted FMN-binding regulatory protein PaiB
MVGFEIAMLQASVKLSQNRDKTNYQNIILKLSESNL